MPAWRNLNESKYQQARPGSLRPGDIVTPYMPRIDGSQYSDIFHEGQRLVVDGRYNDECVFVGGIGRQVYDDRFCLVRRANGTV